VDDAPVKVWLAVVLIAGAAISLGGVLIGAWWLTFPAGLLIGATIPRARLAIPAGALAGLVGWGLPLVYVQFKYGLGPSAGSLAAAMAATRRSARGL